MFTFVLVFLIIAAACRAVQPVGSLFPRGDLYRERRFAFIEGNGITREKAPEISGLVHSNVSSLWKK